MSAFTQSISSYRASLSGTIAVEAAFLLPLLAMLGLGTIDLSYMILQNHKMEQSLVAAGAFMARASDPQSVEPQAKMIAVTGSFDSHAEPVIKNWSTDDISISYKFVANNNDLYRAGDFVRIAQISSSHSYSGFGIIKALSGNRSTLSAVHEQRMTSSTQ